MSVPLEPAPAQLSALTDAVAAFAQRFVAQVDTARAYDLDGVDEVVARFRRPPPEQGRALEPMLDDLWAGAAKGFNSAGPGFFAYIPGGGVYSAALAAFLGGVMNRYVTVWDAAPAFAQIELSVLRWLSELFGYPPASRGVFTSGGSLATFSAIVTARHALLGDDFSDGVAYASDQVHASVPKALRLAGFPARGLRLIASEPSLRVDVGALAAQVAADRRAGLRPFLIVANAGTTNTGAVDPLADLAALARREGLWLHVDAAYGGGFQLTERGRARFAGIDEADSITMDPHKALFLPYGVGALLVRDGNKLRAAHQTSGDYLQDLSVETGEHGTNFIDYAAEMTRAFRGLQVWLPLQLHGVAAFRNALDEKLDLAQVLHHGLSSLPGFEAPWPPQLTVVAFRGPGDDERNRRLLERVNASGRAMLSSTAISGRFVLRACVMVHRTHQDRVEETIGVIRAAAEELEE